MKKMNTKLTALKGLRDLLIGFSEKSFDSIAEFFYPDMRPKNIVEWHTVLSQMCDAAKNKSLHEIIIDDARSRCCLYQSQSDEKVIEMLSSMFLYQALDGAIAFLEENPDVEVPQKLVEKLHNSAELLYKHVDHIESDISSRINAVASSHGLEMDSKLKCSEKLRFVNAHTSKESKQLLKIIEEHFGGDIIRDMALLGFENPTEVPIPPLDKLDPDLAREFQKGVLMGGREMEILINRLPEDKQENIACLTVEQYRYIGELSGVTQVVMVDATRFIPAMMKLELSVANNTDVLVEVCEFIEHCRQAIEKLFDAFAIKQKKVA